VPLILVSPPFTLSVSPSAIPLIETVPLVAVFPDSLPVTIEPSFKVAPPLAVRVLGPLSSPPLPR
jgi:hypothetical protein